MKLKNFDVKDFLENYWQKRPLLIKGGIDVGEHDISKDEIAGITLEEEAHARFYGVKNISIESEDDYEVKDSPFNEEFFNDLPGENWNMMVQEVDQWLGPVFDLRKYFDFIPHWLFDDILASIGAPGGHVGAHLDWYDVFIVQWEGEKFWNLELGEREISQFEGEHLVEGLDVKLLSDFLPSLEYKLEAGDILYIPMGYAHQGVNLSESFSFSVGFRAPNFKSIIEQKEQVEFNDIHEDLRVKDNTKLWSNKPGQLPRELNDHFKKYWPSKFDYQNNKNLKWFAELVTTPTRQHVTVDETISEDWVKKELESSEIVLNPHGKLAYELCSDSIILYANGETLELDYDDELLKIIETLCNNLSLDSEISPDCSQYLIFVRFLLVSDVAYLE